MTVTKCTRSEVLSVPECRQSRTGARGDRIRRSPQSRHAGSDELAARPQHSASQLDALLTESHCHLTHGRTRGRHLLLALDNRLNAKQHEAQHDTDEGAACVARRATELPPGEMGKVCQHNHERRKAAGQRAGEGSRHVGAPTRVKSWRACGASCARANAPNTTYSAAGVAAGVPGQQGGNDTAGGARVAGNRDGCQRASSWRGVWTPVPLRERP